MEKVELTPTSDQVYPAIYFQKETKAEVLLTRGKGLFNIFLHNVAAAKIIPVGRELQHEVLLLVEMWRWISQQYPLPHSVPLTEEHYDTKQEKHPYPDALLICWKGVSHTKTELITGVSGGPVTLPQPWIPGWRIFSIQSGSEALSHSASRNVEHASHSGNSLTVPLKVRHGYHRTQPFCT